MNGDWEPDFIGPGVSEQKLWAKCFDNEVTSLRQAKGERCRLTTGTPMHAP